MLNALHFCLIVVVSDAASVVYMLASYQLHNISFSSEGCGDVLLKAEVSIVARGKRTATENCSNEVG